MPDETLLWHPSPDVVRDANWTAFFRMAGVAGYDALLARADAEPEWFWETVLRYLDFRFYRPYDRVLDLSDGPQFARWCVGGSTNVVYNALDRKTESQRRVPAIVWEGEDGALREWTYGELDAQVCRFAAGLRTLGLGPGDVVALYMPPLPETVAAFWGVVKIGCIVLPMFSGFGSDAVATRLADGGAVAVVTVDSTLRRGKRQPMKSVVDEAAERTPGVRHVVVVPRGAAAGGHTPMRAGRDIWWDDLLAAQPESLPSLPVDAEHPMLLIYTSGTTGKPKGIVHSHCGMPVKAAFDARLAWDFKAGDRALYMADFGWLAGPMVMVGCAMATATFLMAEGSPDFPEPCRYWRLAQELGATIIGMAPTLARSLRRHGDAETDRYDLSRLRLVTLSGEPCDADTWAWVFQHVARGVAPIMNLSGGTEISGGIVSTSVLEPVQPGSVGRPLPGMGADIVNAQGLPTEPGEIGELVLRQPSIGLTRGFWRDPERYIETYWSQLPGLWVHGDLASRDAGGDWFLHGRSDDTIKISGKRTGPAEVEQILIGTHQVADAAIVGVPDPVRGATLVCVVVPAPGTQPNEELAGALAEAIVQRMGSSYRPQRVLFVSDLPRTRNMKVLRRVVRSVLTGLPPGDLSSLLNPQAIEELAAVAARGEAAGP